MVNIGGTANHASSYDGVFFYVITSGEAELHSVKYGTGNHKTGWRILVRHGV